MRSHFPGRRPSPFEQPSRGRLEAALLAGSIAIALNTLVLKAADLIHLPTARGGLLRLLWMAMAQMSQSLGASGFASPFPTSTGFQTGFHLFVGILMALFYAFAIEAALSTPPWVNGALYAAAVWLLNAVFVLPATGEGFAGSTHLTMAGMIWYGTAHTVFFILLTVVYAALRRPRPPRECAHA